MNLVQLLSSRNEGAASKGSTSQNACVNTTAAVCSFYIIGIRLLLSKI